MMGMGVEIEHDIKIRRLEKELAKTQKQLLNAVSILLNVAGAKGSQLHLQDSMERARALFCELSGINDDE